MRYVARAGGVDQTLLLEEMAGLTLSLGASPEGGVTAWRRVLQRHPTAGSLWTLAATALTALDPRGCGHDLCDAVSADPTGSLAVGDLPEEATVMVLGWPDLLAPVLHRRGDLRILVADVVGDADPYVDRLTERDSWAEVVDAVSIGAAAAECDVVLLEASVASAPGGLCAQGSRAAAASARMGRGQVWLLVGEARAVPQAIFERILAHELERDEPWHLTTELIPTDHLDMVVGPEGRAPAASLTRRVDGPDAPELLRVLG